MIWLFLVDENDNVNGLAEKIEAYNEDFDNELRAVSYTHLTLPTKA